MDIVAWSKDELNQRQLEILWDTLEDNPLLIKSDNPVLNQQLNTTAKSIIQAINELKTLVEQNEQTLLNYGIQTKDSGLNSSDDVARMKEEMQSTLLKSVLGLKDTLNASDADISDIGSDVFDAIFNLNETIQNLETNVSATTIAEMDVTFVSANSLQFELEDTITSSYLYINGIEYKENEAYTLSKSDNTYTINWTFNSSNNGFDLLDSFSYKIKYYA